MAKDTIYKITQKSKSGNGIQLVEKGAPESEAVWYTLSGKSKDFVKNMKIADEVNAGFVQKDGDNHITFIKPVTGWQRKAPQEPTFKNFPESTDTLEPVAKKGFVPNYTPEDKENMKRSGILKATAIIVASLGFTKEDTAESISSITLDIYNSLYQGTSVEQVVATAFAGKFEDSKKPGVPEPEEEGSVVIIE